MKQPGGAGAGVSFKSPPSGTHRVKRCPRVGRKAAGCGCPRGHLSCLGQRAVAFKVIGNARCPHGVIAEVRFNACPLCVALYQPVSVLLVILCASPVERTVVR
jgi:hypothetical protein